MDELGKENSMEDFMRMWAFIRSDKGIKFEETSISSEWHSIPKMSDAVKIWSL